MVLLKEQAPTQMPFSTYLTQVIFVEITLLRISLMKNSSIVFPLDGQVVERLRRGINTK